ncbi:hypothetical protein LCGC14_0563630 [marine sediment metagenome]|uniref:Uncharacterized protein n=1 Tax=marine sediment metagenome TaxID=412755 RepID=A0A0F9S4W3_9ZZZZ|nr:MAG: hypothetical protein Lokiarch_04380 [Candidatus Lokiarchaeum sp. GC14_75]
MNKETVLSLINALKTLKDIMINHNKTFRDYLDVRSMFMMNRILYQGERFQKITEDINLLMEKALSQKDLKSYLEYTNKILRDLLKREESLNAQVENAIGDFQSSLNELKNKILDFDSLLDEINNSLK